MSRTSADKRAGLSLTGERTLPGIWHENYWFRRHEAAYRWVANDLEVRGTVLEAGVGEGYGGRLLADAGASTVLGLDLDELSLRHVARRHGALLPVRANLVHLPVRDGVADWVVSAQTLEHLWDQEAFLRECARVLRPGGRLVLTTPNRATFPPGNPFHSRELDADELPRLLPSSLRLVSLLGLHHGDRLSDADRRLGGLVAAQLRAAHGEWGDELRATVAATTARDFVIGPVDRCLDLILVAARRRP